MSRLHTILGAALSAALAFAPAAQAARHEVSGEYQLGNLPSGPLSDAVGEYTTHGGGIRLGYAVFPNRNRFGLVVRAGWSLARAEGFGGFYFEEDDGTMGDLRSRLAVNQANVGLKADIEVAGFFYPYVAGDIGLTVASLWQKSDNAPAAEDGLRETAVAPQGDLLLGTEWMVPDRRLGIPVTVAFHVEGGYAWTGALRMPESGGRQVLSGAVLRAGVGLRF